MSGDREINWSKHKVWSADQIRGERRELDMGDWGNATEIETRRRIRIAVAAYAYEVADRPVMTDDEFDRLAQSIHPKVGTCHPLIDEFFVTRFSPMTGMWIHDHPELDRIRSLYSVHYAPRR